MLVYGDHQDEVGIADALASLLKRLAAIEASEPGIGRHAALVAALIEAGRLQQGVQDADFEQSGVDRITPAGQALGAFLTELAELVIASWRDPAAPIAALPKLRELKDAPDRLRLNLPEGYAFYAVYPEAYADAAERLRLDAPPKVIGLRSIGTSLAAIAAAALGAPPPVTVRPAGDPFDRKIEIDPELERDLLAQPAHYVVVDEGPGLSGSSFGAVADWLLAKGVPEQRIAFLPSHGGAPGVHAQPRHRERWPRIQKQVADLGSRLAGRVASWIEPLIGPLERAPMEISGGGWRPLLLVDENQWPPANPVWSPRKFLLRAGGAEWASSFVGLSEEGNRKLRIAQALHEAGFAARPAGLAHGFLVQRWHGEARPLHAAEPPLEEIASYLTARVRLDVPRPGASLAELLLMARRNAGLALGDWAAERLDAWTPCLSELQARVRPICSDNRMEPHEWIRLPNGKLFKADALDHHAAHDLIGCQDIAWDVVGTVEEFGLGAQQVRELVRAIEARTGRLVDAELMHFLSHAYLAFRLGQASMAAEMVGEPERRRWQHRIDVFGERLRVRLNNMEPVATPRISSLGRQPERTASGTNLHSQG
ncbi:hypothetical protein G7077_06365 [Sphingomonas piscis]|uniref:Uncharacterized protein n=1 Tax=Sphingomonas piscis TaxID=2714943 RepID=A0A6G7YPA9_9SPHN|nr:hypothetical protein [Sphingomonas piscis]QIK78574.1 hypothetical protein G7077_06365 [Sphingomonas piscis]